MGDAMREIDRVFEADHPGVHVDHRALSAVEVDAVLAAAITANAAPDVVMVHVGVELRSFESHFDDLGGALAPFRKLLFPAAVDACRGSDGTVRAIPLTTQGFGWYYNKRLFSAAGLDPERPPRTWSDFLACCGRLSEAGVRPIAWGDNPENGSDWIRRTLAASFFDAEELRDLFSSDRFVRDPRFATISRAIRELRDRGYLDSMGTSADQIVTAAAAFGAGKAAMYLGLLSDTANWKDFSDELGPENVGFFASFAFPGAVRPGAACTQGAGIAFAVLDSSARKDLAADYALSYLGKKATRLLVDRVGALVPLAKIEYPVDEYPVLRDILAVRASAADDIELFYPSMATKEALFRYDGLFIDTREISLAAYLDALSAAVERTGTP